MNKLGFKLLLAIVAVPLIYVAFNGLQKPTLTFEASLTAIAKNATSEQQATALAQIDGEFANTPIAQELSYRFVVESKMLDAQGTLLGGSTFSGLLGLKSELKAGLKATDSNQTWHGQLVDGKIKQQGVGDSNTSEQAYEQGIVFTTHYKEAVFSNVDMLGLGASHPGHALKYMLAQMSYKKDGALSVDLANGSNHYLYQQSGGQIKRTLLQQSFAQNNLDMALTDNRENWLLTLNQQSLIHANLHTPKRMEYDNQLNYQNDNGKIVLRQHMVIEATKHTFDWPLERFVANANSKITSPAAQSTPTITITNQQQLLAALAQLAESNDSELAKVIGAYLVEHYSAEQLATWLGEFANEAREPSLLIYAVQKAGGYPAELLLSQLYQQGQLSRLNKQRVLMSMGRFEGGGEHTLNSLRQVNAQDDSIYADTALLSIGSLAKFGDDLTGPVADILADRLAQPGSEALAIIAINNSGLAGFDKKIAGLLGHESSRVNVAAIKLLAKNQNYRDSLVDFVAQNSSPQTITALRTSLAKQGVVLSNSQRARISAQAEKTSHPVIKQQLLALLNMQKAWE